MTKKCRFCGEMMQCVKTDFDKKEGKLVGWFTCDCKSFRKNGDNIKSFKQKSKLFRK